MKILHITNHVQEIGNGIVNVAVDLACLQAQNGYEIAVASAGGEYATLLGNYGVRHFPYKFLIFLHIFWKKNKWIHPRSNQINLLF